MGRNHSSLRDSLLRKMVGSVFFQDYARTGHVGIPRFLGVAGRWGSKVVLTGDDDCDCGVMLMNLRNLRDSHEQFSQFVVHKRWKQLLNLALRRSRQRQGYVFKIFFLIYLCFFMNAIYVFYDLILRVNFTYVFLCFTYVFFNVFCVV